MALSSILSVPPALYYPKFRAYWFGTLASVMGFQIFIFAQLWLVHSMTGSALYLGYVGLATATPSILLNLIGGVYADKLDQRKLIIITQLINGLLMLTLATLTMLDKVMVWHVLILGFTSGAVGAFDQPARQAMYPQLIDRKVMVSAVALNSVLWQGTRIFVPPIAGLIIAVAGTATAFYIASMGSLVMAGVLLMLKTSNISSVSGQSAMRNMMEGLRFITSNSIFAYLIGLTFFNSLFGMTYITLMPIFAVDMLKVGAQGQGVLLGASGVGALLTTIWFSSRSSRENKSKFIIGGIILSGLCVAGFSLSADYLNNLLLAMGLMFCVGIFNSAFMVSVMSSLQLMVPDAMRGRVMGFYGMTWSIMPLGGMQAGALGSVIGVSSAVALGGLLVSTVGAVVVAVNKQIREL